MAQTVEFFADNSIMAHHWAAWWLQFDEHASKISILDEETLILKFCDEFIVLGWAICAYIRIKLAIFGTLKKIFVACIIICSYRNILWRKDRVMMLFKEQM